MDVDVFDEDVDGCIESIHVRNFFCHDNLEVNFNRNLNFIVGRNGSGKSAILTALVVGLGSRASATNRGNSLTCKFCVMRHEVLILIILVYLTISSTTHCSSALVIYQC